MDKGSESPEEEGECEEVLSEDSTAAVPTPPDSPRTILPKITDPQQLSHPYAIFSCEGEYYKLAVSEEYSTLKFQRGDW